MFPTAGRPAVEIMMPVWSPGFYRVEDYARRVEDLSAKAADGTDLKVEHPGEESMEGRDGRRRGPGRCVRHRLICRQSIGDDQLRRRAAV